MRTRGRKKVNFCSQRSGSDATVYLESASLGRHSPSHSRGWMHFANHTEPGSGLLSGHQGIFPGMEVMIPGCTETCWRASRRKEQQGRAGPDLNYDRLVRAEAEERAGR